MTRLRLTKVDIAAIAMIVGVGAGAHFLGFEPVRRARAEGMAQNARLNERTEALNAKQSAIDSRRAELLALQKKVAAAVRLQSPTTLNQRMAAIPELAAPIGIRVREVVPKAAQPGKRLTRIPITIGGEGPSTHLAHFLAELHRAFPDMEVLSLGISARPEAPMEPARFSMELVWYTRAGSDDSKDAPVESAPLKP